MTVTVIILTFNEEHHIARAIESVRGFAQQIVVVDSGSTDSTCKIASDLGASVLHNPWTNHATQFNWALDHLDDSSDWVLRLDADEIVMPELSAEIGTSLAALDVDIDGVFVSRRMTFLGRPIRHGGLFPIRVLRLFRRGKGRCENRWMDEHIMVEGKTAEFQGEIVDDNLSSLSWWTEKHNSYASREVVDILNLEHGFMPHETVANLTSGQQAGFKRWLKERVYSRLPGGVRAFAYFFYRYILRLGFLDGREGRAFHILQGFWYRFLVDAKLLEVRKYIDQHNVDVETAIDKVLGIKLK
ncbi:MAG: glycosyltransferase family 2 protein [Pseudomonadota bacterium]